MIRRPLNARFKQPLLNDVKTTTMREHEWPVGVPIMLYCWTGKPYRTKQQDVAAVVVEMVSEVTIFCDEQGRMSYAYHLHREGDRTLWQREGFNSQADMDDWFRALVMPGGTLRRKLMEFRRIKDHGADFVTLCQQWVELVAEKWREERRRRGHWVGLEAGFMFAEDERRFKETAAALQAWTVQWFEEQGWRVKIEVHEDGEQFRPVPVRRIERKEASL